MNITLKQRIQPKLQECSDKSCIPSSKCEVCRKKMYDSIELCKRHNYCNICKQVRMYQNDKLTDACIVDHFHYPNDKGPIRGLLCKSCNITEGKLRKDVDSMHSYAELVQRYTRPLIDKVEMHYKGIGGFLPMEVDTS